MKPTVGSEGDIYAFQYERDSSHHYGHSVAPNSEKGGPFRLKLLVFDSHVTWLQAEIW